MTPVKERITTVNQNIREDAGSELCNLLNREALWYGEMQATHLPDPDPRHVRGGRKQVPGECLR